MGMIDEVLGSVIQRKKVLDRARAGERFKASPPITFYSVGSYAAGEIGHYDLAAGAGSFTSSASELAKSFVPFRKGIIRNNTNQIVEFRENRLQRNTITVLNRAEVPVEFNDLRSFEIVNKGTVEAGGANAISVTLYNE